MKNQAILLTVILSLMACRQSSVQAPEKEMEGYLFAYFFGDDVNEEQVHFAVSLDGFNYYALNNNKPVLDAKELSSTGGMRDPHLLRGEDGNFYMVTTDMLSRLGWESNRGMVLLKSPDLVNWTSSAVNIQNRFQGNEDLKRVWAPQTIYDKEAGKYMIYFSMKHGDGPDIIYYAYANEDFTDLESEPEQLFFPSDGKSTIDGDIILKDDIYYMFYKTEDEGKGIKLATTTDLTSGEWTESPDYKQQTTEWVEGSSVFKLNQSEEYILMYDVYLRGEYQFTKTTDLREFEIVDDEISMDFHPRHGSIISITREELNRILEKWGKPENFPG